MGCRCGSHRDMEAGLGRRVNTVLQTCFFHLIGFLPSDVAVESIKEYIRKTYSKRGAVVVMRNEEAVDKAVAGLRRVDIGTADSQRRLDNPVP